MGRLEALVITVGFAAVVIAVAAFDWRLGLGVFGCGLMVAAIDLNLRRS